MKRSSEFWYHVRDVQFRAVVDKRLNRSSRLLYVYMSEQCRIQRKLNGHVRLWQKQIAADLGTKSDHVKRWIEELNSAGYITGHRSEFTVNAYSKNPHNGDISETEPSSKNPHYGDFPESEPSSKNPHNGDSESPLRGSEKSPLWEKKSPLWGSEPKQDSRTPYCTPESVQNRTPCAVQGGESPSLRSAEESGLDEKSLPSVGGMEGEGRNRGSLRSQEETNLDAENTAQRRQVSQSDSSSKTGRLSRIRGENEFLDRLREASMKAMGAGAGAMDYHTWQPKWRNRYRADPDKALRLIADIETMIFEGRPPDCPGAYMDKLWRDVVRGKSDLAREDLDDNDNPFPG